jgi:transglutaminase-like putative cysteine protease
VSVIAARRNESFSAGCTWSYRQHGWFARNVLMLFGHGRSVRAFAAISHPFSLKGAVFGRTSQPAACIRQFRCHFEHLTTGKAFRVKLRVGFEMLYDFPQPTPMLMVLGTHFTRASDVIVPDFLTTDPVVEITPYRDMFGNWCSRMVAPAGRVRLAGDGVVRDSGLPDPVFASAVQHAVEDLPADTLVYLLGSRYCETDRLSDIAWRLFEKTPPGWARVQAICDFVHRHIAFGYEHARASKTAWEAYEEGKGVCRDYAHLAIAFCRCMNIPARYCTGYLSDIGTLKPWAVGDFAGWFEAYIGGHWRTFDPRNNEPRIGRVLIAQGRDASDVPITQTFGPNTLVSFKVWTDEMA